MLSNDFEYRYIHHMFETTKYSIRFILYYLFKAVSVNLFN